MVMRDNRMGLIEQIQAWYAAQCNGDWEHQYGVSVDTLDNSGWSVTVDLIGTSLEHIVFQTVHEDKGKDDWIICEVSGNKFVGRGDPGKLQTILEIFASLIRSDLLGTGIDMTIN
jgi:Immunity protein 53